MKRALITGITGQDGSYLTELLLEKGYEVHGLVRRASTFNRGRIEHLFDDRHNHNARLHLHYGDITDIGCLIHLVRKTEPDEVYNLAAQSHVATSFEMPEYTAEVTGLGPGKLLEALRITRIASKPTVRFYQAGSSEQFGSAEKSNWERQVYKPQNEDTPFRPRSPYGCAKAYAFDITRNYRESYGMFAVNGILFNHESPRRGESFVTRKITLTLAQILAGRDRTLYLGNLEARRDWGHAKEYVEGMWRMLQQDGPHDFVLATGRSESVRTFLEICLNKAGISFERRGADEGETYISTKTGKTLVRIDPHYYRKAEINVLLGDASRAQQMLGWKAKTTLEELASQMLTSDCNDLDVDLKWRTRFHSGGTL